MQNKGDALIGYTGFVGGNILAQRPFDFLYNSKNINEIQNKNFNLVVCAGAPGTKWIANKNPEQDLDSIQMLMDNLKTIKCDKFVLISTIDVYSPVDGVTEDTPIDKNNLQPYSKHRRLLEEFVENNFNTLIIRLPAVYGSGLKKNAIFDLLHHQQLNVNPKSCLQFYWLGHIWKDIEVALNNNLKKLNIAVEPIEINKIAEQIFDEKLTADDAKPLTNYNMTTKFGSLWGTNQPYLYLKETILPDLKNFKKPTAS